MDSRTADSKPLFAAKQKAKQTHWRDKMANNISRRKFVSKAGATGLALGSGIISAPNLAFGAQPTTLKTATLAGGWTNIANGLLNEKEFGKKHDIKFDVFNTYSSVRQYYTDIVTGNFDIGIGAWDFFAKVYAKGAPLQLAGIISTGSLAGYYAGPDGPNSLAELKGKTLSAMTVSGTYLMGRTWAKAFDGIDFEKDVNVQNVPNPPAVLGMVAANRADAGLVWEHTLSAGLLKVPGSKVFLNLNDHYRKNTGRDMPYFCVAINSKRMAKHPKDSVARAIAAYDDMFSWITANKMAFAQQAKRVRLSPKVLETAVDSGRMKFKMRSMADTKNREDVLFAADVMNKAGTLKKINDGFFVV
jgi:NitT/TauT family transport system substrate-binding protein